MDTESELARLRAQQTAAEREFDHQKAVDNRLR